VVVTPASLIVLACMVLPVAPAKAACDDLLSNNTYECRVKGDEGERFSDCFEFTAPGEQSTAFDLFPETYGSVMGCDCKAEGTFGRPDFNASNSFHCVSATDAEFGLAFDGDVRRQGRRIVGEGINDTGSSFVFRCVRVDSCSLPQSAQRSRAPTW
jgi:hypothetical protein